MPFTNQAVVFISHFQVKPGHLPALRVYGPAPDEFLAQLGDSAVAAGVDLVIQPKALGGYLRTTVH